MVAGVDRDATARQLPAEAPQERHVRVGTVVEHERRLQAADRPELPRIDEVADRAQRRRPAIRRAEAVEDPRRAARVQEVQRGAGGRRERLLADDGLAGRRGRENDVRVQDRRQAGDDQVDIGRLDHPPPVGLDAVVAESIAQPRRETLVDVGDRDEPRSEGQVRIEPANHRERRAVAGGHGPGADHGDPDRSVSVGHETPAVGAEVGASISSTDTRRPSAAEAMIASHRTAAW